MQVRSKDRRQGYGLSVNIEQNTILIVLKVEYFKCRFYERLIRKVLFSKL
jgi:hypothetical protein